MDSSNNQDQKTQVVPNPDQVRATILPTVPHFYMRDRRLTFTNLLLCQGNQGSVTDKIKAAIQPHSAHPGPAIPQDFNVTEEGTKEERRAKAQELNK